MSVLADPAPDAPYSNPVPAIGNHADADFEELVIAQSARRSERLAVHFNPLERFRCGVEQAPRHGVVPHAVGIGDAAASNRGSVGRVGTLNQLAPQRQCALQLFYRPAPIRRDRQYPDKVGFFLPLPRSHRRKQSSSRRENRQRVLG
jgi:hypothetical protein